MCVKTWSQAMVLQWTVRVTLGLGIENVHTETETVTDFNYPHILRNFFPRSPLLWP